MLSIVVGDEDRSDLDLDLDAIVREGARRMLMSAYEPRSMSTLGLTAASVMPPSRTVAKVDSMAFVLRR